MKSKCRGRSITTYSNVRNLFRKGEATTEHKVCKHKASRLAASEIMEALQGSRLGATVLWFKKSSSRLTHYKPSSCGGDHQRTQPKLAELLVDLQTIPQSELCISVRRRC